MGNLFASRSDTGKPRDFVSFTSDYGGFLTGVKWELHYYGDDAATSKATGQTDRHPQTESQPGGYH